MICIPDRCLSDADCYQGGHCVRAKTTDILGTCDRDPQTLESDGYGAGWETFAGCEVTPSILVGKGATGAACTDPVQCSPTCCSCSGGQAAALAAKCTDVSGSPNWTCASPADACAAVQLIAGVSGTCTAP
jgi:hypothetical protein